MTTETETLVVHCSALARALACPQSLKAPEVAVETESDAARLGSAVHEALALEVKGKPIDLLAIANKWGVEVPALAMLYREGKQLWEEYDVNISYTELSMNRQYGPGIELVGTADIIGEDIASGATILWDWKTGAPQDSHRIQVGAYLLLAGLSGMGAVAYIRDATVEVFEFTSDDLLDLQTRVVELPRRLDEPFCPGYEQCRFCPRSHECPGRHAYLDAAAGALVQPQDALPATLRDLALLKGRADLLRQALGAYDKVLKETLRAEGPIDLGDGQEMALETQGRDSISAEAILTEGAMRMALATAIDSEPQNLAAELAEAGALKVTKGKLLQLVAANAKRGQKGKSKDAVMQALRTAGAVTTKSYQVIRTRPIQKELTDGSNV